jgi:hypothetical protein
MFEAVAAGAKSDLVESDFAQESLKLEHFRRRTGIRFGGKCSGRDAVGRERLTVELRSA